MPRTVQPLRHSPIQQSKPLTGVLVASGADESEADQLIHRITGGSEPSDRFEEAAIKSFIDSVATLLKSGGRLTSVH